MPITATHIAYLHTCKRKLWLFHHGIQMEHTSDQVAEGKLTGDLSYADRAAKYTELVLPGGKIDYYDAKNEVVHEVKHSNKVEHAHIAQVKYYLYLLVVAGVKNPSGLLEYPRLRQTESVQWQDGDKEKVEHWVQQVNDIIEKVLPPPVIHAKICKSCSYYDFCYSE
ncbi:MAG TPA: CRISPR-associated protein Cas4 [Cyclobacteriaceae bacterium]